ncbi:MAG: SusC/RagA family TonB-linked outer membrane protein [Chitinophagaceae bacterium]
MQIFVCVRMLLCPPMGSEATKPKHCLSAQNGTTKTLRKAARIMKLTAFLLLGACLHVHAVGFGQTISLSEKEVPIETVFRKIEKQTSFKFLYADRVIKEAKKVSIQVNDATIDQVLALVFKDQIFGYELNDNTVLITPGKGLSGSEKAFDQKYDLIEVRGVIKDENGAPVQGVNVVVKGTSKGTTTNLKGEFVISNIDESSILIISSVGYEKAEILIKGKNFIVVQLRLAVGNLDEMQVIAYGTTTKRLSTGNVGTVKSSEIQRQPVNNPLLALQGKVPGLSITQSTGLPGTGVKVLIQGMNSLFNSNDPLYVVDGVPYVSQLLPNYGGIIYGSSGTNNNVTGGNPLNFINPSDIESISVLKDADATAVYGSRGANGVILITTKKGKAGRSLVDLNLQQGWGKVARKLDLLNIHQYLQMRHEAINNDGTIASDFDYDINGVWDTTRSTDWQKELIGGSAKYSNASLTVSGGTTSIQYLIGGTYHKETTVFPGDASNQKGAFHFNINSISPNQKLKIQVSGNYLFDNTKLPAGDLTADAVTLAPNAPALHNDDGNLNWAADPAGNSTWVNPLAPFESKYVNNTYNLISNTTLSYTIFPGLDLRSSFGYTNMVANEIMALPLTSAPPEYRPTANRLAFYSNNRIISWILEPQINYKRSIGKAKVDALVGLSKQRKNNSGEQITGTGYNSDFVMDDPKSAASVSISSSIQSIYKYIGAFARLSFNWDEKYLLNLTGRRDGSSRFGVENRFHNFGSIGAAWIFTKETVLSKLNFLSYGKVKASYGTTGNDQIGDYKYLNLYNTISPGVAYQGGTSMQPGGLPNRFLQWEETKKFQAGMELGFFQDRVLLSLTYFKNVSSNQLLPYRVPITTGFNSILKNFPATVHNTGWEFSFNSNNINIKDFSWSSQINLTISKNKLASFPGLENSSYANLFVVGQPLAIKKLIPFAGVNTNSGLYQFVDSSGTITESPVLPRDQTVLKGTDPTLYGGFENHFQYKGWQLDVLFQFVKQIGQNYVFGSYVPGVAFKNQPTYVLDRWQKTNDVAPIQKFNSTYDAGESFFNASYYSDAAYTDASYVRLKNISLSWQFPKQWLNKVRIQNLRVFSQAQNLITFTKYKGLDPENLSVSSLPPLRVITLGVQATF